MAKASEGYTCHEMEAAEVWAEKNGTYRKLAFELWFPENEGDGNANVLQEPQWAPEMEVWGNSNLNDGDMVHSWDACKHEWDALRPYFEARVHGDGKATMSGSLVLIR